MVHLQGVNRPRVYLIPLVASFLAFAFPIGSPASNAATHAKTFYSHSKHAIPEAKAALLRNTRPVNNPSVDVHREFLNLQEGQKGLQKQLERLTSGTQLRIDGLQRRLAAMTDELVSAREQSTGTQRLLTASIHSMRLLLIVTFGLILVLCGVVFFAVYQLRRLGELPIRDRKKISAASKDLPNETTQPQWKVGA